MSRTLAELLADAERRIRRCPPGEVLDDDSVLVDIRSQDARERDGVIPGARHVPRTVLEWRVASRDWRNVELDGKRLTPAASRDPAWRKGREPFLHLSPALADDPERLCAPVGPCRVPGR